jgi:hypothetical protein
VVINPVSADNVDFSDPNNYTLLDTGLPALNPANGIDDNPSAASIMGPPDPPDAMDTLTSVPLISQSILQQYTAPGNNYTVYHPNTGNYDDLPIPELLYTDWNGKQASLPGMTIPVRIQHLTGGKYCQLVVDPQRSQFDNYIYTAGREPSATDLPVSMTSGAYVQLDTGLPGIGVQYFAFAVPASERSKRGSSLIPRWLLPGGSGGLQEALPPAQMFVVLILLLLIVGLVLAALKPIDTGVLDLHPIAKMTSPVGYSILRQG